MKLRTFLTSAVAAAAALAEQGTTSAGLSAAEAAQRLASHGPNRLTPPQKRGPLLRFLLQFHNVLIYVLLGAAVVTAALGHLVDTGVILGVVVINALIGFIQEGKAEKSLDAIRNMLSLRAVVMRDGRRQEIDASELVPGDIVVLASGDKVPADLRLIELRNLVVTADLIVRCALKRRESRGLHFSRDYPATLKKARNTILRNPARHVSRPEGSSAGTRKAS